MSDFVTQVKQLQRQHPAFKQAWITHCDESLGGMYDPARHGDDELQAFVDWWNTEGVASAGPHDALVQEVKQIQRSGPDAKEAWVAHCATTASPGVHDPAKHDDDALQSFIDWWLAEGGNTCDTGNTAAAGGARRAPAGGGGGGGGGGGANHASLVDQVKAIQRSGPAGKQAWQEHCDTELGGMCDPRRHDEEVLQVFVNWWSEEGGGEAPAAGMPSGDLVQQVKNFQRSSPASKEAWAQYCQQHLGGVCDPNRHDASILQAFLDENGGGGGGGGHHVGGPIRPVRGGRPVAGVAAAAGGPAHANFIRTGAALSPQFKAAWAQYCQLYGQGISNPAKHDEAFIREFADYAAGLMQADLGAAAPAAVSAPEAQKRLAPAPPAGPPPLKKKIVVKKKIADEIVRLNKEVGFAMPLRLPAVAAALSGLEESIALDILTSLETQADVGDPNELVISMCQLSAGSQAAEAAVDE